MSGKIEEQIADESGERVAGVTCATPGNMETLAKETCDKWEHSVI